ncbi:MAG: CRTAC1 family protein [Acidobacteria bacterium]|nr:CRTAC1 family protein [Acidobacteriota bacterium]
MRLCVGVLAAAGAAFAQVQFADVTAAAGIKFKHNAGKAGKKFLPETLGSGCAFLDYNNDNWPDIFLVNGRSWVPGPRKSYPALYRNNKNGTFTDVTAEAGLTVELQGMGVAAGDFDNDGNSDLYVTAIEGDRLFRNLGTGKFADVTKASGIANIDFSTSAAWLDYDRDGKIDLFVANYVKWTEKGDLWCSLDGQTKSYCTPESYKGTASKLYRNLGGGKFEDVSKKAGVGDATSKSLGIAIFDMDNNGWPDIFVANDTQPNKLYKNNGNGTFTEAGVAAGVAFGEDGTARGAMGVDAADYDRSGRAHLLVGNFSNQMLGLYHNEGTGLFVDEAPANNVGRVSLLYLAFGAFFFDYDNDGLFDIFTANGHIEEEISRVQPRVKYAQNPLVFRNLGNRKFEHANAKLGAAINRAIVARGAAYADFDRDGDLDVLLSTNGGPAYLYRNDGGNANNWVRIQTAGKKSNRDGYGAVVRVKTAGGQVWSTVRSGSSYCSQSERVLSFGLAKAGKVDSIEVVWPSGEKQLFSGLDVNKTYLVEEGAKAPVVVN